MANKISVTDVAKAAGVAPITVSRVVNTPDRVRPATRAKVEAAMKRLGYRPNRAARTLRTGRTQNIGLIVRKEPGAGDSATIECVASDAFNLSYTTTLALLPDDTPSTLRSTLDKLLAMGVDGIIISAESKTFPLDVLGEYRDTIIVTLDSNEADNDNGTIHVSIDQAFGAQLATKHLIDLGHPTVYHVAGPANSPAAQCRCDSWRQTLLQQGIEPPEPIQASGWTAQDGYAAAEQLLKHPDCTAVFAANDYLAFGIANAFKDHGLSVPEDLSLIGFDDYPNPYVWHNQLDSVKQDYHKQSRAAIERIIAINDSGDSERYSICITPTLVLRGSSIPFTTIKQDEPARSNQADSPRTS